MRRATLGLLCLSLGCTGTTGDRLRDFPAAASGPPDTTGGTLEFTTDRGWHVLLSEAKIHIGALYLDQSRPTSGAQDTSCILPGTYVAQETSGQDVDLLSPIPQLFPALAHGTTLPALVGQVWLTGGDVNSVADQTRILSIAGTADRNGVAIPFSGRLTIGTNFPNDGSSLAGASPICKQRIVSMNTALTVEQTGGLLLRIDPRRLFVNVDFAALSATSDGFFFQDDPNGGQPSRNLFNNLQASGPYSFIWSPAL